MEQVINLLQIATSLEQDPPKDRIASHHSIDKYHKVASEATIVNP